MGGQVASLEMVATAAGADAITNSEIGAHVVVLAENGKQFYASGRFVGENNVPPRFRGLLGPLPIYTRQRFHPMKPFCVEVHRERLCAIDR